MLRWDLTEMELICVGLFFPFHFLVMHYITSSFSTMPAHQLFNLNSREHHRVAGAK